MREEKHGSAMEDVNQLFGSTQVCSERVSLVHLVTCKMDGQQT